MRQILTDPKTVFIDVRAEWEFEEGHIPNALHIPLERLAFHLPDLRQIEGPMVLYCVSGNRSGMALRLLKQAGIENVFNGGGFSELKTIILN